MNDLFGVKENTQLSLEDVLAGLRYVMDYRLKGGRLPNLDFDLMKRLCEGLLLNMSASEGGLLKRRMTVEANEAFILFGEFLEEGLCFTPFLHAAIVTFYIILFFFFYICAHIFSFFFLYLCAYAVHTPCILIYQFCFNCLHLSFPSPFFFFPF